MQWHTRAFPAATQSLAWAVRPRAASARSVAAPAVFKSAWAHVGGRSNTRRSLESLSSVNAGGTLWAISAKASFQRLAKVLERQHLVPPA